MLDRLKSSSNPQIAAQARELLNQAGIQRKYGSVADGTAREWFQPATTHPMDHISTEAIGYAVTWFGQTLQYCEIPRKGVLVWRPDLFSTEEPVPR